MTELSGIIDDTLALVERINTLRETETGPTERLLWFVQYTLWTTVLDTLRTLEEQEGGE